MCEDSASFDLTSSDIALCIGDISHILLKYKPDTDSPQDEGGCSHKGAGPWLLLLWILFQERRKTFKTM